MTSYINVINWFQFHLYFTTASKDRSRLGVATDGGTVCYFEVHELNFMNIDAR